MIARELVNTENESETIPVYLPVGAGRKGGGMPLVQEEKDVSQSPAILSRIPIDANSAGMSGKREKL